AAVGRPRLRDDPAAMAGRPGRGLPRPGIRAPVRGSRADPHRAPRLRRRVREEAAASRLRADGPRGRAGGPAAAGDGLGSRLRAMIVTLVHVETDGDAGNSWRFIIPRNVSSHAARAT